MAALKIDEKKKPVVTLLATLAIVASVISIFLTQCERAPKINMKPYLAVGQVMAEETSKLLDRQGQVVVVCMDSREFKMPTLEAQLETFLETLKKQGGVTVAATEKISLNGRMAVGPEMGVPSSVFFEILEKHPGVSAIVSFIGAPSLNDEEIARLGSNIPKIVVFSSFGMGLKKLFEEDIIQVAIVPQFGGKPDLQKKPETLREWFDQYYKVITAENASSLAF